MTSNNPFADRLREAAKEGYVNGTRRDWKGEYARREAAQERAAYASEPSFAAPAPLATPKQVELIRSLLDERDLAAETRVAWNARILELHGDPEAVLALTREKASNLITYLFGLPVYHRTLSNPMVPAGHYAIEGDGVVTFLRVDRPTEGKWAGKVFVAVQHGDDYTNVSRAAGARLMERVMDQGVMECSVRYGREIGKCGVCHRTLTNEESRAAGIGPVCRDKSGW